MKRRGGVGVWGFVWLCALVGGAGWLSGCGDDSGGGSKAQVSQDTGSDSGGDQDAGADTGAEPDTDTEPDAEGDTAEPDTGPEPFCGDGTCDPDEDEANCVVDCDPAPVFLYDPLDGRDLMAFPDDYLTREDPSTLTGLRLDMGPEKLPYVETVPDLVKPLFDGFPELDGFGTSAGAFLRFSRPLQTDELPVGEPSAEPGSPLVFGYLDDEEGFVRVPVELVVTDEGATLILRPMRPLPPRTRAVAGVLRQVLGVDGEEIKPGAALTALLAGQAPDPALDKMVPRYRQAVEALVAAGAIESADQIGAMVVFTTQSIWEGSLEIAQAIRARPFEVAQRQGCEARERYRVCELTFAVPDLRADDEALRLPDDLAAAPTYELPMVVYLPLETQENAAMPYQVALYSHGLGGDRHQAGRLADFAAPLGWATIAVDAPEHGDHPRGGGQEQILSVLSFFGLTGAGLNGIALRDNWRHATYDKLSAVELIKAGLDVDGDGEDDLSPENMVYLGVSLGGIMGPEFLAMTQDVGAGVLVVPGGRVTDVIQFGDMFQPLIDLVKPADVSRSDVDRLWPLLQTLIEAGDAVNYAPYLLQDRLEGGPPVQVLMAMVIDDDIVPEPTNMSLARAMNVPIVPPVVRPVGLIDQTGPAPIQGNMPDGGTAGLVQVEWILKRDRWETATHNNVGDSNIGAELWFRFLQGYVDQGTAVIVDPYQTLDLERP